MRGFLSIFSFSLLLVLSFGSCKKIEKPKAQTEHEQWSMSLNDSINQYKSEITKDSLSLVEINEKILSQIEEFSFVEKPREVEGYYILSSWKEKYPLKETGLIARLNKGQQMEIMACLKGGKFTKITLKSGDEIFESPVVAHDQAFNYVAGNLNTVSFIGESAAEIGNFIAKNVDKKITVDFFENNKTGALVMSEPQKKMIAQTWHLYELERKRLKLENNIGLNSHRIHACRRILEKEAEL